MLEDFTTPIPFAFLKSNAGFWDCNTSPIVLNSVSFKIFCFCHSVNGNFSMGIFINESKDDFPTNGLPQL